MAHRSWFGLGGPRFGVIDSAVQTLERNEETDELANPYGNSISRTSKDDITDLRGSSVWGHHSEDHSFNKIIASVRESTRALE
jgi:hypothetical protein